MNRVAVGSTNPVKVRAAAQIFGPLFPDAEVCGIDVPSGVAAQPVGEEETRQGAINRARAALEGTQADWGVGLEGGVAFRGNQCWMVLFGAVVHKDGRVGVGHGAQFLLPPAVARGVAAGEEVGPLIDQLSGDTNSKQKGGAIGFLTRGTVVREDTYAHMVAAALVQFLHPELYNE